MIIQILLIIFLSINISSYKIRSYYATTTKGLENVLYNEIKEIPNIQSIKLNKCGVSFTGDEIVGFKALIGLRTSLKLLELIKEEKQIINKDKLYDFIQSIDWLDYIKLSNTFKCDTILGEVSNDLSHSHFTSLTIKNSIIDQFRDKMNERPSIDMDDPDVILLLYLHKNKGSLYRVWSGNQSMHKRGYRDVIHKAMLRESTAAALLQMSSYQPMIEKLIDPMCGSGTIAIEAALILCNTAPGLLRYNKRTNLPNPLRWNDISIQSWELVYDEAVKADNRQRLKWNDIPGIYANDYHNGAIQLAINGAEKAGVKHLIKFNNIDIANIEDISTNKPIKVLTNPPWDYRLKSADISWNSLRNFQEKFVLYNKLWLLTGNHELINHLNKKPLKLIYFQASSIEYTFANF